MHGEVIEAGFRHRASAEDDEKLVQNRSETSDERCEKRKREIVTVVVQKISFKPLDF